MIDNISVFSELKYKQIFGPSKGISNRNQLKIFLITSNPLDIFLFLSLLYQTWLNNNYAFSLLTCYPRSQISPLFVNDACDLGQSTITLTDFF